MDYLLTELTLSNSIQKILARFAVTVARLQLSNSISKHFNTQWVFSFYRYYAPNFCCKIPSKHSMPNILTSLNQILRSWQCFWKNMFVILGYSLMPWQEKYHSLLSWMFLWWIQTDVSFLSKSLKELV